MAGSGGAGAGGGCLPDDAVLPLDASRMGGSREQAGVATPPAPTCSPAACERPEESTPRAPTASAFSAAVNHAVGLRTAMSWESRYSDAGLSVGSSRGSQVGCLSGSRLHSSSEGGPTGQGDTSVPVSLIE